MQLSLSQIKVSRVVLLEMFCYRVALAGGRQKSQRTFKGSLSSLEFPVSPRTAEERGRRKQIHVKNNINNSICLDYSAFLNKNNCQILNNVKVPTGKQIIMERTIQKCFCLVHLGWLGFFKLEWSFGFLFFSSEVLLGLPSPVLFL